MMYFATAIGNYKEQYLALFSKYINYRTYEVNFDKLVSGILDLLILNQKQYIKIKNMEKQYVESTKTHFSALQKDFIRLLMIKSEISNDAPGWFKLTKEDQSFLESQFKTSLLSNETIKLKKANIIRITNDKPRRYQLQNYTLLKNH